VAVNDRPGHAKAHRAIIKKRQIIGDFLLQIMEPICCCAATLLSMHTHTHILLHWFVLHRKIHIKSLGTGLALTDELGETTTSMGREMQLHDE